MQCNNIIQSYNNSGTSDNQSPPASGSTSVICNDSMPRDLRPMTFHEFRKQKEQDRCSKFSISKTKKRSISTANKKARLAQEVKVQVGVVRESVEDGRLKKIKGRTIPVLFNEDDNAKVLREKAVEKHARHFKQFDRDDTYVILYQDMTLVKDLPGSNTPFTLGEYKRDLLKPYCKIYFWLCP